MTIAENNIAANTLAIAANTTNIATNTTNIATNTANIATNTSNLNLLAATVVVLPRSQTLWFAPTAPSTPAAATTYVFAPGQSFTAYTNATTNRPTWMYMTANGFINSIETAFGAGTFTSGTNVSVLSLVKNNTTTYNLNFGVTFTSNVNWTYIGSLTIAYSAGDHFEFKLATPTTWPGGGPTGCWFTASINMTNSS